MVSSRLVLVLSLLGFAAPALAEPNYFQVTGVAVDDTLNVRSEPSAKGEDIGDIAPDAKGIEVTALDESGDWGRIVWEDGDGWIATRFLEFQAVDMIPGTDLPQGLLCGGTEPFWSMRLSGGGATFSDFEGEPMALGMAGAVTPEARGPFPVVVSHGNATAAAMSVIEPMDCSDGMSDRTFPWRILFLLRTAEGQRYVDGCCQLPLEDGSH